MTTARMARMARNERMDSTPTGGLGPWSGFLGLVRRAAGQRPTRARRAVILFESLEGRAVPAALPIATAMPAATPPAALAVTMPPLGMAPRAVAAPASAPSPPTAVMLAVASDSGTRNDNITNILTPTIQGRAPAGTLVTMTVTGVSGRTATLAVAMPAVRVPASGIWAMRLPTLAAGPHAVAARVTDAAGRQSMAANYSFSVDTARPTAVIRYTPNTDTIVLQFSERVSGVALKNIFITGRTADGMSFPNTPLTDPRISQLFGPGSIKLTSSTDGSKWTLTSAYALATPGTYTVRLATTGITDSAGNGMLTGPMLTTKIV